MSTGPHVTTSLSHVDPRVTTAPLPQVLPAPPPTRPDDTSSLTRPDPRRVEATRQLAARMLPDGATLEQLVVQPGDHLIGAAARLAAATHPDPRSILQGTAAQIVHERDQLVKERNALRAQVDRLVAGAAPTAGDPHDVPTEAQTLSALLSLDAAGRLQVIAAWKDLAGRGTRCLEMEHDGRIVDLERQLREHQAREAELERQAEPEPPL